MALIPEESQDLRDYCFNQGARQHRLQGLGEVGKGTAIELFPHFFLELSC